FAGQQLPGNEHVSAEVVDLHDGDRVTVAVMPVNTRRSALDLPEWMSDCLKRLTIPSPLYPAVAPPDLVPPRFDRYQQAFREGLTSDSFSGDANELIIRAASTVLEEPAYGNLHMTLATWLDAGGLTA